jgi:hypothetical protein
LGLLSNLKGWWRCSPLKGMDHKSFDTNIFLVRAHLVSSVKIWWPGASTEWRQRGWLWQVSPSPVRKQRAMASHPPLTRSLNEHCNIHLSVLWDNPFFQFGLEHHLIDQSINS